MQASSPSPNSRPAAATRGVTLTDQVERRLRVDIVSNVLEPAARLRLDDLRDRYEVAIYTPGHTPACMVHVMGDAAFVGDTLFMPDGGSARADFPGGDAATLFDSIQKVLSLPDATRLFMCHDYGPNGRDIQWETTVAAEKEHNIHVGKGATKEQFVKFRTERDATLAMPKLIIPSLQVNMRAGEVPTDKDGRPMLKVPVNGL